MKLIYYIDSFKIMIRASKKGITLYFEIVYYF